MKRIIAPVALGITLLGFTACTTQPDILKDTSKIPVVMFGEKHIVNNNAFITRIPAGTAIPFNVHIEGDVFVQNVTKTFPVKLKQDTYLYYGKNYNNTTLYNLWVSHDKKHWKTMDEMYKGAISSQVSVTQEKASIDLGFKAMNKQ